MRREKKENKKEKKKIEYEIHQIVTFQLVTSALKIVTVEYDFHARPYRAVE